MMEGIFESAKGGSRTGTTRRGMGPVYADKVSYNGIRLFDLADESIFAEKLKVQLAIKNPIFEAFQLQPTGEGLRAFFASLMRLDPTARDRAVRETLAWAHRCSDAPLRLEAIGRWILRLAEIYPGDIGVLSPLLLNLLLLQPGDTMFLEAGVLHAYLEGTGIELMANSDNVIRGGLTSKHVDVDELLSILRFEGRSVRLVDPDETAPGQRVFHTPAEEFRLAEILTSPGRPYRNPGSASIELLIILEGEGTIEAPDPLAVAKGDSLLIPASVGPYRMRGSLHLYRAFVPL